MRHAQRKKTNLAVKLLQAAAMVSCSILLGALGVVAYSYWDLNSAANQNKAVNLHPDEPEKLPSFDGAFNIVVVGSDSGGGDPRYERGGENLADVTILLHVSADRSHAAAVSIPRDTIVNLPACTAENGRKYPAVKGVRFNSSLSRGGLACTVKTLETLTGLSVPYAVLLQFNSVITITQDIGGVPVCLSGPINDKYTGLSLTAGEHNISGATALAFLRSRHGIGDGSDLARIRNQQSFLSSMLRKIRGTDFATQPQKAYSIVRTILSSATFSTSLNNLQTLGGILLAITKVKPENFVFMRYPTQLSGNVVHPVAAAAKDLNAALAADQPIKLLAENNRRLGVEIKASSEAASTNTASADETNSTDSETAAPTPGGIELQGIGQTGDQQGCAVPYGR